MNNREHGENQKQGEWLEVVIKEIFNRRNIAVKEVLWQNVTEIKMVWDINYVTEKTVTLIFPEDLKKSLGQMSFFNLEKKMAEIELKPHFKPC